MALGYLLLIPVIFIGYILFADAQFKTKDKKYAIPTTTFNTSVPTSSSSFGFSIAQSRTPSSSALLSPVLSTNIQSSLSQVSEVTRVVVVTATRTPEPTLTPNPYATLHLTLTALWHTFTVTPDLGTAWSRPLYVMGSDQCFANCGFRTATPTPFHHE